LISITDARGNAFLVNAYDDHARVIHQQHGAGAFDFSYVLSAHTRSGEPVYDVDVRLKNGATMLLAHNATGQVIRKTVLMDPRHLDMRQASPKPVPVTTLSKYNRHGELIERAFPDGRVSRWRYDDRSRDVKSQGNLLMVRHSPAAHGGVTQGDRRTTCTYDRRTQRRTSIRDARGNTILLRHDDKGNLVIKKYLNVSFVRATKGSGTRPSLGRSTLTERFRYNKSGQLTQFTDTRGSIVDYLYYPENDPLGTKGSNRVTPASEEARQAGIWRKSSERVRQIDGPRPALDSNMTTPATSLPSWTARGTPRLCRMTALATL
jgi:YD repeat-containing protein